MNNADSPIVKILQEASADLLFISESDYAFEAFEWSIEEPLTAEKFLHQTNHPQNAFLDTLDLDDFFAVATMEQNWRSVEDREIVKRYKVLVKILEENLINIKVYRTGRINIDVYLLGKTKSGTVAGLSTKVVET